MSTIEWSTFHISGESSNTYLWSTFVSISYQKYPSILLAGYLVDWAGLSLGNNILGNNIISLLINIPADTTNGIIAATVKVPTICHSIPVKRESVRKTKTPVTIEPFNET